MIEYQKFTLDNGLVVYVHEDRTTPLAVMNILYNVGSKDEQLDKTGFAHLFEHLMFGGSINIPSYDTPLQNVGGENNAFTSADITNYYISLPSQNLETAFWLESDRMLSLNFDEKVLEIQKKVVIEEFKQRYLNQPYGDVWLKLRPLAYKVHPYSWPTIGKDISHIENATLDDVKAFFYKFYVPNNAIMVVAGNVKLEQIKKLSQKWFGPIPSGNKYIRQLPLEPMQDKKRILNTTAKVPLNAIYKCFHTQSRLDNSYYAFDFLGDILGRGQSSRLYQALVKDTKILSSINGFITGSVEQGLLVVEGKLNENVSFEEAEAGIDRVIEAINTDNIDKELQKVKNQAESTLLLGEVELLNRAMNLAYYANLGKPELINEESKLIQDVTVDEVKEIAKEYLREEKSSVIYYSKN